MSQRGNISVDLSRFHVSFWVRKACKALVPSFIFLLRKKVFSTGLSTLITSCEVFRESTIYNDSGRMSRARLFAPPELENTKVIPAPVSPNRVPRITARRAQLAKIKSIDTQKSAGGEFSAVIPIALHTPPYSPVWGAKTVIQQQIEERDEGFLRLQLYRAQRNVRDLETILEIPRISASEACQDLIEFVMRTKDTMVPSVHGKATEADKELLQQGGCCNIA